MTKTIDEYIYYINNIKHYSKQTVSSYNFDLKDFLSFCNDNEILNRQINDFNLIKEKINQKA